MNLFHVSLGDVSDVMDNMIGNVLSPPQIILLTYTILNDLNCD